MVMKHFDYQTKGTCSRRIELDLDDENRVRNVRFYGGCDGNLKAIPALVEGMRADEVAAKLGGIRCGFKDTSCGDQLAKAVLAAQAANGTVPAAQAANGTLPAAQAASA